MLLYVASNIRPDIEFAVHQVARFPTVQRGLVVKRTICYLIATRDKGICFKPDLSEALNCYVDEDILECWEMKMIRTQCLSNQELSL